MSLDDEVRRYCELARAAARKLSTKDTAEKNRALGAIADALTSRSDAVLDANRADVAEARERGTRPALIDRLMLDAERLGRVADGVREIAALADPVGETVSDVQRPTGLRVRRVRVPLGVIAMIYESRPNVTVEASALALKAGNAIVLRGGSEAHRSNQALAALIRDALTACGLPEDAVSVLPFTDRDAVRSLVGQSELVDLAIPRGGEALIRFVTDNARVPVVQHYKGVCHLYVDAGADLDAAARIVVNAKLSRPGVCNALECLLVDAAYAEHAIGPILTALAEGGCELRGCERTRALFPGAKPLSDGDLGHEFLDPILAVKVVDGLDGALAHIARFGSGHTEAIVTPSEVHAARFRREVDAACVVVNASTRFHDGGELGLGAEIGIATSRIHWRGPMGLESLTTMKWIVDGDGHVRR